MCPVFVLKLLKTVMLIKAVVKVGLQLLRHFILLISFVFTKLIPHYLFRKAAMLYHYGIKHQKRINGTDCAKWSSVRVLDKVTMGFLSDQFIINII